MKWIKHTAFALAAGAALSLSALAPGTAAPVGQSAAIAAGDAAAQSDGSVIDVRRHGHYGGRHHGYRRHGHRRHGFGGWWVPFVAAPLLYGGYAYGRGYDNSCYSECRAYNGPNYCRYNWRRYC